MIKYSAIQQIMAIGTSPNKLDRENRSISIANAIYIVLPIVYLIFMTLDIEAYLNPPSWSKWDQFIVPIFILLCGLFILLNHWQYSVLGRVLFLITWLPAMHLIPIIAQNTPPDYYLAYPLGLIFHSLLIQTLIQRKQHPIIFFLLLSFNFILTLFFSEYLLYFDKDVIQSGLTFLQSKYYKIDEIHYWLLFNFLSFYLLEALDYRETQLAKRNDQLYTKNNLAGISFWQFKSPMSLAMSHGHQVEWVRKNAILKECNHLFASYYSKKSSNEILGYTFLEVLQNDKVLFDQTITKFIENEWALFIESKEKNIDGEDVWFINWMVPTIENNHLTELHITQMDISKQKKAEKMQEVLLENLKEYAFLTSHKLRSPLSNIMGITNMLDSMDDLNSSPKVLEMLKASTLDLDKVIREMNDVLGKQKDQI